MTEPREYLARREALKARYLSEPTGQPVATGGVDHLALICTDMDTTIRFYTEVMGMRLVNVITNHDDPTSTHIFLDMGGGNQLAFFDFPEHGPAPTQRGIGSMHHVALKATADQLDALVATLEAKGIAHDLHRFEGGGSVYLRDPDNILLEVTTGY